MIISILEDKKVPMIPNEFMDACEMLVGRAPGSVTAQDVQPLVDWYTKQDGNSRGGTLSSVLSDGNTSDERVNHAYGWARESGDWLGVALALVIQSMSETGRKLLKLSAASGKQPRR